LPVDQGDLTDEGKAEQSRDAPCGGVGVAVFEGALFLGLAPEDFDVAVGVEGRVELE
jgi:hypothetical protein